MSRGRATALLFAVLAVIIAAIFARTRGPAQRPASAPASEFSAERAFSFEREIFGADIAHPIGSAAHDAVRDRLAEKFRTLGYDVTIQRTFACNPSVVCAPLANVIARPRGDARPDALLLVAHYDSVPSGPGASDDGQGMAALVEIARAVRPETARNPIVFLLTDGEESGLLGAEGFVADPSVARSVAAVVNIEARGTAGPSYLFETSRRNEWLMRIVARALPRPSSSSLFFNIYELLPNDTDLTVFKRGGFTGVNFANLGRPVHYHSRLDNLAHVTPSTLQDHGDHLLATARALANSDLRSTSADNAVWFDVLSFFIVWWPQRWSLGLAILALAILLVAATILLHDGKTTARAIGAGVGSFFLTLLLAGGIGWIATWFAGIRAGGAVWVAHPGPAIAAMWLIGAGISMIVATRIFSFSDADGLFLGHAICWAVVAIALSVALPGGSYLAIVPAMMAALCVMLRASADMRESLAVIVCSATAAILIFPLAFAFYDTLGKPVLPVIAILVALVATMFAPFIAGALQLRNALVAAVMAAAIACVAMANLVPTFTPEWPRHISLRYFDDGTTQQWQADGLGLPMMRVMAFGPVRRPVFTALPRPWLAFVAAAPALNLQPAEVHVVSDTRGIRRQLKLQLRSPRGAQSLALIFHAPSLASVRINGIEPPPPTARTRNRFPEGWHQVVVRAATVAEVEIDLGRNESIDAVVLDTSYGLPPEGAALAHARDESLAMPIHEGDITTTLRRVRL